MRKLRVTDEDHIISEPAF